MCLVQPIDMASLRELGAWMKAEGVAEVAVGGIHVKMHAAVKEPELPRFTLQEQEAFARTKREYDEKIQYAATEGLP